MLSRTCTVRRTLAALAACLAVCASPALAQEATVAGTVTDSSTGRPLDGVRVDLRSDGITVVSAVSNASGRFALRAAPGTYTLTARRLDYRERTVAPLTLTPGERRELDLALAVQAFVFNPVVVSASRTEEKTLEAPAGVTVLDCYLTLMAVPFYAACGFRELAPMTVPLCPGIDFPAVHMRRLAASASDRA